MATRCPSCGNTRIYPVKPDEGSGTIYSCRKCGNLWEQTSPELSILESDYIRLAVSRIIIHGTDPWKTAEVVLKFLQRSLEDAG